MKAIQQYQYGDVDTLVYEDVAKPTPDNNEVLLKIHAAGVNPIDWKTRQGKGIAATLTDPFPLILGWDVSGVVEQVGTDVSKFEVGNEVYGMISFPALGKAYAEYTTALAEHLAHKPEQLSHVEAAAMPLAALTAWQALFDNANLSQGQTVLIHAAAGGVGHFAVQIAKWRGARVIATASLRNKKFLEELGVDQFIDYNAVNFTNVVNGVDVVFDTVGGAVMEQSLSVLKPQGVLVTILAQELPAYILQKASELGVQAKGMLVQPNADQLVQLSKLVSEGHIKPTVQSVLPLSQAKQAHKLSEQGHVRGKVVLQVG